MIYDTIIIGGGASGLYSAAHSKRQNGLIVCNRSRPGMKLLMAGGGQCNLTHGGDIKDFLMHYGENGKKIRGILYKHNNKAVISYFTRNGVPLTEREDGKVFPDSGKAEDVLSLLLAQAKKNGFSVCYDSVECISPIDDKGSKIYRVTGENDEYRCRKLIVASGGCSYPETGSDGSMFAVLEDMGIALVPHKPALTPIFVQDYPYADLSGISFQGAEVRIGEGIFTGDLLFTHRNISGPVILNVSRYVSQGDTLRINYLPSEREFTEKLKRIQPANNKMLAAVLAEFGLPKAFAESLLMRAQIEDKKFSSFSGAELVKIAQYITSDTFCVSALGSYRHAMVTAGGVDLTEVNLRTLESKRYPGMYIVGEALDIDGDTGGYNLQFAFSSGYAAAKAD